MRKSALLAAFLMLGAATAWAQQELAPSTDQGPLTIKQAPLMPDKDGVYRLADGVTPPALTNAVPAAYPPGATETDRPHLITLSAVIGIDGVPTKVQPVNPNGNPYQDAAVEAVSQSRFQPGTLNGKPVPVLVYLRVPFFRLAPPVPRLLLHYGENGGFGRARDPLGVQPGDTPPKAIHVAPPEYSDEARRKKIQGVVIVSVLVTAEGEPTDIRVERPLGYGLDEKAVEAAARYQFQPAARNGNPVPRRIMIEMNFKLY
ncbi:MAG: energy transducer TonB [Terracidiphilus sp.]|jgi:TonB family protein